jgi:hypothetical protein
MLSSVEACEGGGPGSVERSHTPQEQSISRSDSISTNSSPSSESVQNSSGSQSYLSTDTSNCGADARVSQAPYLALSRASEYDAYHNQSVPRPELSPKEDPLSPKYAVLKPVKVANEATAPPSMGLVPATGYPRMSQYARTSPLSHAPPYQPASQLLSTTHLYPTQADHMLGAYTAPHQYGVPSGMPLPQSGAPPQVMGTPSVSPGLAPPEVTPPGSRYSPTNRGASVYLCNRDLWTRFHAHTTEMIITKQGRSVHLSASQMSLYNTIMI